MYVCALLLGLNVRTIQEIRGPKTVIRNKKTKFERVAVTSCQVDHNLEITTAQSVYCNAFGSLPSAKICPKLPPGGGGTETGNLPQNCVGTLFSNRDI